jgi:phage gp36-like protein
MCARYDVRILGDLVSDSNTRVTVLQGNVILQQALDSAAGEIDSYALRGGRYTLAQLQGLTGQDQQFLFDLNCALAFCRLRLRRGVPASDFPQCEWAQKMLEDLAAGKTIFATLGAELSGLPFTDFIPQPNYNLMNLLRDRATPGQFTPRRRQKLPPHF